MISVFSFTHMIRSSIISITVINVVARLLIVWFVVVVVVAR